MEYTVNALQMLEEQEAELALFPCRCTCAD
jgi:hypothetical protein